MDLTGSTVAVIGGDARMGQVAVELLRRGAAVRAAALELPPAAVGAVAAATPGEALDQANLVVLPVQGMDGEGYVFTSPGQDRVRLDWADLARLPAGAVFFVGTAPPALREAIRSLGIRLVEYRESDAFAIANSVPSAEGAIYMAMAAAPITIHGSQCLVVGNGRTGRTLARTLQGLGARVAVAARRPADLAAVEAAAQLPVPMGKLAAAAAAADFIFNTVPAPVLPAAVLAGCREGTVLIDLASAPGGTDFAAAGAIGMVAQLAPGLPGQVAPVSAGRIIAGLVVRYLEDATADAQP